MKAASRRQYRPEEFHNLSEADSAEMVELQLSREDFDRYRLRVAHGNLCAVMIHGRRAQDFFQGYDPATATRIGNALAPLIETIPDYLDFVAEMDPSKFRR